MVAFINLDGEYIQVSDERFKKNITRMGTVLDKVLSLKPTKYKYINNSRSNKFSSGLLAQTSTGFISQDVLPIFPELVSEFQHETSDPTDTTTYYGINYAGFSVVAIKAIQEQQLQIQEQQLLTQEQQLQIQASNDKNSKMMELIEKMQLEIKELKLKIK